MDTQATEVGAESDRRLSELQRISLEANGMQKAIEHLRLVVKEQRKREERLRHQLHDSQESVKALEDALKKSATNLVQRKEVERRNRQEMSKAKKITRCVCGGGGGCVCMRTCVRAGLLHIYIRLIPESSIVIAEYMNSHHVKFTWVK